MAEHGEKRIVVIGAGLGGLSAAVSLACKGYSVDVFEKNEKTGGKLNSLSMQGYSFDLGPSILTLPHVFESLFSMSGRKMSDYLSLRPVRPHWRNFFEDGTVVDLHPDHTAMASEAEKVGEPPSNIRAFLDYSRNLYKVIDRGYFRNGLDTPGDFMRFYGLGEFRRFDLFRSMHQGVGRRMKTTYFRDIFDFFIKYVGSSAYRAPAFMNCLPTIQFDYDLWYVEGGMYNLAIALTKLAEELGVGLHLGQEVCRIATASDSVTRVVLSDSSEHEADAVVCNMEAVPAYKRLLDEDERFMRKLEKFEPACSGLVIDLGLDITYPELAHHNFFYSSNQEEHFRSVFEDRQLPSDPTLYVVAAGRTDPGVAPPGGDVLKVLPHIPYIDEENPVAEDRYVELKDRVIRKLERMGLSGLRDHIVVEHLWTPRDIERRYYSNKGSIYGVVSDRFKNLAFKVPKRSSRYSNLFFVGGSVNPGGGMPMVALCGQRVAEAVGEAMRG